VILKYNLVILKYHVPSIAAGILVIGMLVPLLVMVSTLPEQEQEQELTQLQDLLLTKVVVIFHYLNIFHKYAPKRIVRSIALEIGVLGLRVPLLAMVSTLPE
jgi:hypothetical protein